MPYISTSDFQKKIREGEALGIPRATTYKAMKAKGYEIEGDPSNQQVSEFDASMRMHGVPFPEEQYGAEASQGGFIRSALGIAGNVASDIYGMVRHPVETAKGLAEFPLGVGELLGRGVVKATGTEKKLKEIVSRFPEERGIVASGFRALTSTTPEQQSVIDFGKQYGITEEGIAISDPNDPTKQTLTKGMFEHPLPIALAIGGGLAKSPAGAKFVERIAPKIETPIVDIKNALQRVTSEKLQTTAQSLYQSALKPTQALLEKYPKVVETGLKEGIPVRKSSLDYVENSIDLINNEIGKQIANSKAGGTVILTENVLRALDSTRKFFNDSIGGSKYAEQLNELADTFLAEQGATIPVETAQRLKVNTYNILRKAYGELKTAEVEGKKALARGLKEEIVGAIPELKELNLRESQLIGLEKALERFAGRYGNRELIDLTSGFGGAVGLAVDGLSGGVKGFALSKLAKIAFDHPAIKSQIAIILNKIGKRLEQPKITPLEELPPEFTPTNIIQNPPSSSRTGVPPELSKGKPSPPTIPQSSQGSQVPINPLESPK